MSACVARSIADPDAAKWLLCIVSNLHLHHIVKKVNLLQFRNT